MIDSHQPTFMRLRDIVSERTNPIAFWTGSGLSQPAGIPGWEGLQKKLCAELRSTASTTEGEAKRQLLGKAENAERESNPWVAMQILYIGLGQASYKAAIRDAFKAASGCEIPSNYCDLWELQPQAILNLNLDRLATRACSDTKPGLSVVEFNGVDANHHAHVLKGPRPFIANLHGVETDSSTWVLTSDELVKLHTSTGYKRLIESVFAAMTVVFVGISADDVGAGGLLANLTESGIDTGAHYWITHRGDLKTRDWAQAAGIQPVLYTADRDHSGLRSILKDLRSYVPQEHPAKPVLPAARDAAEALPSAKELETNDAETIRRVLNVRARSILEPGTEEAYAEYEAFCRTYDVPIYRAWYTTIEEPENKLLGYTLLERLAHGAFGEVYRALDKTGREVAVKVLHEGVRKDLNMLAGFRRGVRSMQILSEQKVAGMVPYHEASEIPAFVSMDLVNGPNLLEAIDRGQLREWRDRLNVIEQVAKIVREAHRLPQRVLHRDIKPANIMLRGFDVDADSWDVVVLDFDLSWHRDAVEASIQHLTSASGYLAPEQLQRDKKVSTRHGSVDSFGLGMTIYHLCTGNMPMVGVHRGKNWKNTVAAEIASNKCVSWVSLPQRMSRVVVSCAREHQKDRWDLSQVLAEVSRLRVACTGGEVLSAELIAEELVARSSSRLGAVWNADNLTSSIALASGAVIGVRGNESTGRVEIAFGWNKSDHHEHRRKVSKWIRKAFQKAESLMTRRGWRSTSLNVGPASGNLHVSRAAFGLRDSLDESATALSAAIDELKFR